MIYIYIFKIYLKSIIYQKLTLNCLSNYLMMIMKLIVLYMKKNLKKYPIMKYKNDVLIDIIIYLVKYKLNVLNFSF